ncbi:MAG: hypothetical protein H7X70_02265, partial [Candidatus Kapabacteria bacterium]|nr:hypothetical protein [Candidatus Kapabacteria bacterium]
MVTGTYFLMLRLLTIVFVFLPSVAAYASVDSCLAQLRPHTTIGEKHLLEITDRWQDRISVDGTERDIILRNTGYADSAGDISSSIKVEELVQCISDDSIQIRLIRIRGTEGTKDESIYLFTFSKKEIVARTLIAALQATCDNTFLRGCSMEDDGSIRVRQLRHDFSCDTDEFQKTVPLPGLVVRLRQDGTITEVIEGDGDTSTPDSS